MKRIGLFKAVVMAATFFALAFTEQVAFGQPCPEGEWYHNPANGHLYRLTNVERTWSDAEVEAVSMGGHLVTINDGPENDWLITQFADAESSTLWIGLYQDLQDDDYSEPDHGWKWIANPELCRWVTGNPTTCYVNWQPPDPNDPTPEDCAEWYTNQATAGTWASQGCQLLSPGLIELEPSNYAASVQEFLPGAGWNPLCIPNLFGPPDWDVVADACGIGRGGSLTLEMEFPFIDQEGDDLAVYEYGENAGGADEPFDVWVSVDAQDFLLVGSSTGDYTTFDLAGIGSSGPFRYVRVIDTDTQGLYDGADIDAVEAFWEADPCVRAIFNSGSGTCANHPRFYGDANHDGVKNIVDVICEARVAFQGVTFCSGFEVDEAEVDYGPNDAGCGDGLINIVDVIIVARIAFQNLDDICCGFTSDQSCAEVTGGAPHCPQ